MHWQSFRGGLVTVALAALFALSSDAYPTSARKASSPRLLTLPIRRVERRSNLPAELRHQQDLNRARRVASRAAGLPGSSNDASRPYDFPANSANSFNADSNQSSPQFSSPAVVDGGGYTVSLKLGTPPRNFNIILDSGSSDFWVDSSQCTSFDFDRGSCGNHSFFDPSQSSSLARLNKAFSDGYGSGNVAGEVVNDTLVLAGVTLEDLTFGIAHNISASFARDSRNSGLMGLGGLGLSNLTVPAIPVIMRDRGLVDHAIVSYHLGNTTDIGEITFGGLDSTKFDPTTAVTVNTIDSGFWLITLEGVSVDGTAVAGIKLNSSNPIAVMDTGTTLLVLPTADAKTLHAQIPGTQEDNGQFTLPCNTTAIVSLRFGGRDFEISSKNLIFERVRRGSDRCISGIGTQDGESWTVGDTFLKNVYFSTNFDDNTVTLAKLV
ncbi:Acid protease [Mycena chlorophos]|uniref:Acid protease n=1 Tax=Mycena chlorophos TaxID=658473 RepID=A0A8H6T997_MYCCL|nr:Acid protease [Mycena chlorophos]